MRYASCLTVAPTAMEATLGGSGGITPDPVLETGRDGAKALEERRQRFWWIRRTGTQIERDLQQQWRLHPGYSERTTCYRIAVSLPSSTPVVQDTPRGQLAIE